MSLSIIELGTKRRKNELRIGTVRRPPRGVRKEDFAKLDYYDVWFPMLSPSAELMKEGQAAIENEKAWLIFCKKFKAELAKGEALSALELIAKLSHQTEISIGCYCKDEKKCHRSVLRELLVDKGADILN